MARKTARMPGGLFCYWCASELGLTQSELARKRWYVLLERQRLERYGEESLNPGGEQGALNGEQAPPVGELMVPLVSASRKPSPV